MSHGPGSGDKLARGATRATYMVSEDKRITEERWAEIFPKSLPEAKAVYLFNCPNHGLFVSDKECFLSGGYPQLDEYKTGKCPECEETSVYAGYQPQVGGSE